MSTQENKVTILKDVKLVWKSAWQELAEWIVDELAELDVGAKTIASTIKSLLSAKTKNNAWFEMDDNKVILDTVKLVLNMNWVKTGWWININLFNANVPSKDEKLQY